MRAALALAVLLLAGCGAPQEVSKQAEEVHSRAAEGALLAKQVASGKTFEAFAAEHASALRHKLDELRPAIEDDQLAAVAEAVDRTLAVLERHPGDRRRAAVEERALRGLADRAEALAG
jgi:outer membrane murein-binding lipoprotein Lpp